MQVGGVVWDDRFHQVAVSDVGGWDDRFHQVAVSDVGGWYDRFRHDKRDGCSPRSSSGAQSCAESAVEKCL